MNVLRKLVPKCILGDFPVGYVSLIYVDNLGSSHGFTDWVVLSARDIGTKQNSCAHVAYTPTGEDWRQRVKCRTCEMWWELQGSLFYIKWYLSRAPGQEGVSPSKGNVIQRGKTGRAKALWLEIALQVWGAIRGHYVWSQLRVERGQERSQRMPRNQVKVLGFFLEWAGRPLENWGLEMTRALALDTPEFRSPSATFTSSVWSLCIKVGLFLPWKLVMRR